MPVFLFEDWCDAGSLATKGHKKHKRHKKQQTREVLLFHLPCVFCASLWLYFLVAASISACAACLVAGVTMSSPADFALPLNGFANAG